MATPATGMEQSTNNKTNGSTKKLETPQYDKPTIVELPAADVKPPSKLKAAMKRFWTFLQNYYILPTSWTRIIMDYIMMIIILYNYISVVYRCGFEKYTPWPLLVFVDIPVDLLCYVNIIMYFLAAKEDGLQIIKNRKVAVKAYLSPPKVR